MGSSRTITTARKQNIPAQQNPAKIPVACPDLGDRERRYVTECLKTGWISSAGPFVPRFEATFAQACGVAYGVAVNSGTGALHLALEASGIGPGDEVLIPAWTFVATANAVVHAGARPVFVDVSPADWGIEPGAAARRITRRTKAIIAVHLFGHPADMTALRRLARRTGLLLIEDASQAFGAKVEERRVGGLGDVACFSLFANKVPTTGEGGILVTRDRHLATQARRLRDHGMGPRRYWHSVIGYNYAMSNLQAAVGLGQLERLDTLLRRKEAIRQQYIQGLQNIPGLGYQPVRAGARVICWLFPILVEPRKFGMSRARLSRLLSQCGIETRPFFPPLHRLPPYRTQTHFPVAERIAPIGLALPSGPAISNAAIDFVIKAIRRIRKDG
jgi:perosamine synthetase